MVRRNRWAQVAALVTLGLALICATARAQVFSAPKNVSSNLDYSFTPQIAVDSSGNIYMAWEDDTATNSNILFSRSTDGGATFSVPKNLSSSSGFSYNPRMAVDSLGGINVVWLDTTPGNANVFFSRSTDGGVTFSTPKNVSNNPSDSTASPQIAVDSGGNLFVVWESDTVAHGILFSRSTDGGATFSASVKLSNSPGSSIVPQIAVYLTGNVNVVWEDTNAGSSDISFSRSADAGATFSTPTVLSNNPVGSTSPQIAVDLNGNINVVWANSNSGNFDILFSRSADKGATFSTPKVLSNTADNSVNPQIAADGSGGINVVWDENTPPNANPDIFFTRSGDGGVTFSSPKNLSSNSGFSTNASMAVDSGGGINVVWEDNTPGNYDIFFVRSADAGVTFSTPRNLSNNTGLSSNAQIAVDKNGNINVGWSDSTPGISQIFFSRGTSTQPPVAPTITTQPASQTVMAGQSATFSVTATGTAPLMYQWQRNATPISNANAASYTTPPTTMNDNGAQFTVTVSNSVGSTPSNPATLTVDPLPNFTLSAAPASVTIIQGGSGQSTITVTPQNGFNGSVSLSASGLPAGVTPSFSQTSATTSTLTLTASNTATTGTVTVTVTGTSGSLANTTPITLTVNPAAVPPSITTQPANQTVTLGQMATFTVVATGTPPLSYQWQKNGTPVGANSPSYTTPPTTALDNRAQFTVTVRNSAGSTPSNPATLTVNSPPVANAGPDQTVPCAGHGGTPVTLNGSNSSDPNGYTLSFVWKDASNNVVGTTAIVKLTLAMGTHTFTLTVTDSAGLSSTATTHVTVVDTTPPTLKVLLYPHLLWPPNHELVKITAVIQASDFCDSNPAVVLVSITSNEPDSGLGDGDLPNDIQAVGGGAIPFGTDVRSFMLRAERSGEGTGRVYTVTYMVKNPSGLTTSATAQVLVPHAHAAYDPPFWRRPRRTGKW